MSDYSINVSNKSPASTLPCSTTLPLPFCTPKNAVHIKLGFAPISPQTALAALVTQDGLNDAVHTITYGLVSTIHN